MLLQGVTAEMCEKQVHCFLKPVSFHLISHLQLFNWKSCQSVQPSVSPAASVQVYLHAVHLHLPFLHVYWFLQRAALASQSLTSFSTLCCFFTDMLYLFMCPPQLFIEVYAFLPGVDVKLTVVLHQILGNNCEERNQTGSNLWCVCLLNTVQELRSMAKIQDKVMNEKSSETISMPGRAELA